MRITATSEKEYQIRCPKTIDISYYFAYILIMRVLAFLFIIADILTKESYG